MIDEDVLRDLMAQAAESVPAPGDAPEELLATLATADVRPIRRLPSARVMVGVAAAVALVVVGVAVFNGGDGGGLLNRNTRLNSATGALDSDEGFVPSTTVPADMYRYAAGDGSGAGSAGSTASASGGTGGGGAVTPGAPAAAGTVSAPIADTARVVKTGSLDLSIATHTFEATVERITSLVIGAGGYVSESTTSESGDSPSGSITVRIPSTSFDQLLGDLRKLGDVQSVTSKGTDVTAEFTDLAARLSALNATRDRLYAVLQDARNVGDIIAVQDRITGVQTEIEQIQGQQRLLDDQASFGTLSVTLAEPGATVEALSKPETGLGHAWLVARHRFGDSVRGLIEWTGSAALPTVLLFLALLALRLSWPAIKRRQV